MKINLVVNSFPTPSETFLFNLVVGLESRGVDVTVIAGKKSIHNDLYTNRMKEWSGKIKYIPSYSIFDICRYLYAITKNFSLYIQLIHKLGLVKATTSVVAFDTFNSNNPDVVHFAFSGIAVQYVSIINSLNKRTKTIVSCRGSGEKLVPIVDQKRAIQLKELFQVISLAHCVSKDMQDTVTKFGLDISRSFINYPSINQIYFNYYERPTEIDVFNIVTSGRLSFEKGYPYALIALSKLKKLGYKFKYHILGDGPDINMIQFMINELDLVNEVFVHGKVSIEFVKSQLHLSHIFLLPSLYEGISNAALEAMATGVPIVTTQAGGMAEVVKDGFNGKLIPCYDPYALADALAWVMSNYKDAVSMSVEARKTVEERFTHERQIQTYITKYEQLLAC